MRLTYRIRGNIWYVIIIWGMTAHQGGVITISVGIDMILLCVTNITSDIHQNNGTYTVWRVNWKGTPTRRQPVQCLCTPHTQTFFGEGRRGYNQGSCVYLGKACGGWVYTGVNGVDWMDVEGLAVLREHWGETQRYVSDSLRQFYNQSRDTYEVHGGGLRGGGSHDDPGRVIIHLVFQLGAGIHTEKWPQDPKTDGSALFAVVAVTVVLGTSHCQAFSDLMQFRADGPSKCRLWVLRWRWRC